MDAKWDKRFLELARHIASWSKDPSTQVGAVIVDNNRRIVSTGFNGFPRGVEDSSERLNNREIKYEMVLHAEDNAIISATEPLVGYTIYVWPLGPCSRCAIKLIQCGITRIVYPKEVDLPERVVENHKLSALLLSEAGISVDRY